MFRNRKRGKKGRMKAQNSGEAIAAVENDSKNGIENDSSLSNVVCGCRCRIRRHHGQGAVRQRLLDMGFIPNAEVEVLRVATLGDPIEVKVGDSWVTLRKHEAEKIEITDC